ncbi:hypothetical protein F1559_000995 [Cyanidiococcus yangmingshanensis]|uniref:Uncharacterized protein n=1 Tax=Cyanidiococcus yangmingshanensis TaxID=2690220 RepID=A0A7J7IEB6_9RHOD|nr:hypothetical protein F1559_000995 [Cyanidiococcus yangmingshanensis]
MHTVCVRVTEQFCRGHGNFYPAAALLDNLVSFVSEVFGAGHGSHGTEHLFLSSTALDAYERSACSATTTREQGCGLFPPKSLDNKGLEPARKVLASNFTPLTISAELLQARFREVIRPPCKVQLRIERYLEDKEGLVAFVDARVASRLVADASVLLRKAS